MLKVRRLFGRLGFALAMVKLWRNAEIASFGDAARHLLRERGNAVLVLADDDRWKRLWSVGLSDIKPHRALIDRDRCPRVFHIAILRCTAEFDIPLLSRSTSVNAECFSGTFANSPLDRAANDVRFATVKNLLPSLSVTPLRKVLLLSCVGVFALSTFGIWFGV